MSVFKLGNFMKVALGPLTHFQCKRLQIDVPFFSNSNIKLLEHALRYKWEKIKNCNVIANSV